MQPHALDPSDTLPRVVAQRARTRPDQTFVRQVGGGDLTYAEVHRRGQQWSRVLQDLGVEAGDRVGTMLPPTAEGLCVWLGIGNLLAIDTGVNIDFRNRMLHYVLDLTGVKVVVVAEHLLEHVQAVRNELPELKTVVVVRGLDSAGPTTVAGPGDVMDGLALVAAAEPLPSAGPEHGDTACLTFTSGTTGPSKAVIVPWGQLYTFARLIFPFDNLDESDVFYSPWPAYHTNGRFGAYLTALIGGTIVYNERFRLSRWIDEVEKYGVTLMVLFPLLIESLRTATEDQAAQMRTLRDVIGAWGPDSDELADRFGLRTRSVFAMTECPPLLASPAPRYANHPAAGRLQQGFPGYEARIVDENDQEVPDGVVGQMVVRSATPWTMNAGYFNNPAATAVAWRNGWFHTGDALRRDADGNFYFVDRTTDSIRRRGETISSHEVEAYVHDHPEVAECAAVAVPNPRMGDNEVKIVARLTPGSALDHEHLASYLEERMPRFMDKVRRRVIRRVVDRQLSAQADSARRP